MDSEQFFLKWNNFESNLASGFADLLQKEAMVDVTLAAEGKILQAHKIILSVCSSYFRNMFQVNPCQHPIVILKDVRYQEMADMLDFMYKGEANVRQEDLPSFLKLAETLKVKGLAGNQGELNENSRKRNFESQISHPTKDSSYFAKEVPSNDFIVRDTTVRKRTKRCTSPLTYAEPKDLPHSPDIKFEIEKCDNDFVRNIVDNGCPNAVMKEERLSDNSLDSYGENHVSDSLEMEKNAGPSTVDENCESVQQEFIFRFNPKRVPIWDFYIVNYDYGMAVCKVCHKVIKTRRRDGTRNVLSHMRNLHPSRRQSKDYCFMESCFGGHLLILEGHIYRRKSLISGRSYWNCCNPKCFAKGVLLREGEFQLTHSEHNHEPNLENLKRKEKLVKLKKLALLMDVPGQMLLEALQIKEDPKRHLSLIRTWRSRDKKRSTTSSSTKIPLSVGVNYKLLPSRIPSKELLFHSGYYFRQDSVSPRDDKCKYWRCRAKKCKARAKTDHEGNLTILQPFHDHPSERTGETSAFSVHMPKVLSSDTREVVGEINKEQFHVKSDDSNKFTWKIKRDEDFPKREKGKMDAEPVAAMEETSSAFCPSENFNIDKLMAETLEETYCVAHEFSESLNLLKSE